MRRRNESLLELLTGGLLENPLPFEGLGAGLGGTRAFAYSGTVLWQGDFTAGLVLAF